MSEAFLCDAVRTPIGRYGGAFASVRADAAASIVADAQAVRADNLTPRARLVGAAVAGVAPHPMGMAPAPASKKLLGRLVLSSADIDVIELNEAFAAQALPVRRQLGLPDDAEHMDPNGGALALGPPLGMSGARPALTAVEELQRRGGRYALCTMGIGVGQGIAPVLERV